MQERYGTKSYFGYICTHPIWGKKIFIDNKFIGSQSAAVHMFAHEFCHIIEVIFNEYTLVAPLYEEVILEKPLVHPITQEVLYRLEVLPFISLEGGIGDDKKFQYALPGNKKYKFIRIKDVINFYGKKYYYTIIDSKTNRTNSHNIRNLLFENGLIDHLSKINSYKNTVFKDKYVDYSQFEQAFERFTEYIAVWYEHFFIKGLTGEYYSNRYIHTGNQKFNVGFTQITNLEDPTWKPTKDDN